MALIDTIHRQIIDIKRLFISANISVSQNEPIKRAHQITWSGYSSISYALRSEPYDIIYDKLLENRAFHFKLLDGSLIQLLYRFERNEIIEHRLAYYPSPHTSTFEGDQEEYEALFYSYELFSDIQDKKAIICPVRFDFKKDDPAFKEMYHSYSHLTLGNYTNSRIPVSGPLTPKKFVGFIMRSFYFDLFDKHFDESKFACSAYSNDTIQTVEKRILHVTH